MQTFLTFADFEESARVLDDKRLGKQRVECKQILQTLLGESTGWRGHPAVLMWKGHEVLLCVYAAHMCLEFKRRGFTDALETWFRGKWEVLDDDELPSAWWIGHEPFHLSHRSNLLRKDKSHYSQFWMCDDNLPYFWPTQHMSPADLEKGAVS